MKLSHKIKIDFLEFCKTGKFNYLEIGQSQEYILNNFPDLFDGKPFEKNAIGIDIWLYGAIEFHFFDGILTGLFSDHFHNEPKLGLHGGEFIEISPWIFAQPNEMTLSFVIHQLLAEKIDFSVINHQIWVQIQLKSGVLFTFDNSITSADLDIDTTYDTTTNPDLIRLNAFSFGDKPDL